MATDLQPRPQPALLLHEVARRLACLLQTWHERHAIAEADRVVLYRRCSGGRRTERRTSASCSTSLPGMEVAFHERSRDVWQEIVEQMPAMPSTSQQ